MGCASSKSGNKQQQLNQNNSTCNTNSQDSKKQQVIQKENQKIDKKASKTSIENKKDTQQINKQEQNSKDQKQQEQQTKEPKNNEKLKDSNEKNKDDKQEDKQYINNIPVNMFKQSREEANKLKMNSTQYTGYLKFLAQENLPASQETADKFIQQYQTQYSHTFNNNIQTNQTREEREQFQQQQRAKILDRYLKQKQKEIKGGYIDNNINIPIELLNEKQLDLYSDIQNEEKVIESLKKIIDLLVQKQQNPQELDNNLTIQSQQQILRLQKQKTQKEEDLQQKILKLNKEIMKSSNIPESDIVKHLKIKNINNNGSASKINSGNDLLNKRANRRSSVSSGGGELLINPEIAPHYKIKRTKDRSRTYQSNINNKEEVSQKIKQQFQQINQNSKNNKNNQLPVRQSKKQYTYTQQPKSKFSQV